MLHNQEIMLPRGEQISPVPISTYLENFEPVKIQDSWEEDFISMERQESSANLVYLLDAAVLSPSSLGKQVIICRKHLNFWDASGKDTAIRFYQDAGSPKVVDPGDHLASRYRAGFSTPGMAVLNEGQSGSSGTAFRHWLIPLPDRRIIEIRNLLDDNSIINPLIDGEPASRATIEEALNLAGSYFQEKYLEQRYRRQTGVKGFLNRLLFPHRKHI